MTGTSFCCCCLSLRQVPQMMTSLIKSFYSWNTLIQASMACLVWSLVYSAAHLASICEVSLLVFKRFNITIVATFVCPLPKKYYRETDQTWNLSKILHRRIFRLKILHRQFHLISTVLVRKNTKNEWKWRNLHRWQQILHSRRDWRDGQISPLPDDSLFAFFSHSILQGTVPSQFSVALALKSSITRKLWQASKLNCKLSVERFFCSFVHVHSLILV